MEFYKFNYILLLAAEIGDSPFPAVCLSVCLCVTAELTATFRGYDVARQTVLHHNGV